MTPTETPDCNCGAMASFAASGGSASRSKFKTIVADPPWDYAGKTPPWRSTSEQTYKLMSLDEICALPVGDLATGDAHLYLWAVLPMMREAYVVIEAWGFTAETMLTWCKWYHTSLVRTRLGFNSRTDLSMNMGCCSNGKISGSQPEDRGSTPRLSTAS